MCEILDKLQEFLENGNLSKTDTRKKKKTAEQSYNY